MLLRVVGLLLDRNGLLRHLRRRLLLLLLLGRLGRRALLGLLLCKLFLLRLLLLSSSGLCGLRRRLIRRLIRRLGCDLRGLGLIVGRRGA